MTADRSLRTVNLLLLNSFRRATPVAYRMQSSHSKALWYSTLAASVSAVPSAHGTIRYTDVVPDTTATNVTWDLDNGGTADFRLEVVGTTEKSQVVPLGNATGIADFNGNADRLNAGETIGPATLFSEPGQNRQLYDEGAPANFDWNVGSRGFLGLRIQLTGVEHYGWADVSINRVGTDSFNHTLFAYAYEDAPGQAILAGAVPEPSTAALLVAGAAGVASLRRRRSPRRH